jgi:hypothetical protein
MKRPWIYLDNPILNATDNSYRMAVRISTHHDSALNAAKADPFILGLYNSYHPVHQAFIDKYNAFVAQGGLQQGDTLNLRQLLRLLSGSKIGFWDSGIQIVYPPNTPKYMALLPNGRGPFQTGTQTQRISAVKGLSDGIGADAALATVKTDVSAFFTELNTANTTQKGSISVTKTLSDDVDAARIAMCIAQYADLGAFIQKHAADTIPVEQYFDLAAMRKGQQVLFTGSIKKESAHTIVKRTFGAGDNLELENPGVTELQFYLAAIKDAQPGSTVIKLAPGAKQTIVASALGNLADPFLMVFNPDAVNKGEFVVEMV